MPRYLRLLSLLPALAAWGLLFWAAYMEQAQYASLLILSLAGLLLLPIYAFTHRFWFAALVAALPLDSIFIISQVKWNFLEMPLLFFDAYYLTGAHLLDLARLYFGLTLGIGAIVCGISAGLIFVYRQSPVHQQIGRWVAIAWLILLAPLALSYKWLIDVEHNNTNAWQILAAPDHIFESLFVSALHREPHLQPVAKMTAIMHGLNTAAPSLLPDLVTILEESGINPDRILRFCQEAPCADPAFFDGVASGDLQVHTFGGLTWVSEFAFLVGLPHKSLGTAGYYTPYTMVNLVHHSLPQYLRQLGYATVVICPTEGSFINSRASYTSLGFDEVLDRADLGLNDDAAADWRIPDQTLFGALRLNMPGIRARHTGKPLFLYMLTLSQHGPYGLSDGNNTLPPNTPRDPRVPAQLGAPFDMDLTDYFQRLDRGTLAYAELRRAFERDAAQTGRPVLFLHWGDHHPGFTYALPQENFIYPGRAAIYTTYYTLQGKTAHPLDPELLNGRLDIAYLSTLLLKAAGLPLDTVFATRLAAWRECGGRYLDCERPIIGQLHRYLLQQELLTVEAAPTLPETSSENADATDGDTDVQLPPA